MVVSGGPLSDLIQWRIWPALITVSLPLAITLGIYGLSVGSLTNDVQWTTLKDVKLNSDTIDQFARDVGGRFQFGIASALLRIAAAAAIALAIVVVSRRIGLRAAVLFAAVLATA